MKGLSVALSLAGLLTMGGAWASPTGFVYTANERAESISQVQLDSGVVKTVKTGIPPHNVQVTPDGKHLLAIGVASHGAYHGSSAVGSGQLWVLETAALDQTPVVIEVGKGPVQVGFSADGRQAYVSLSGSKQMGLIDSRQQRLVGKVAVGRTPIQMVATNAGLVYVANQGSAQAPDQTVSVVDPATKRVVKTLVTGKGAHGTAVSSDSAYVFVSNIEAGTFSVIDTATQEVIAEHQVGAGPNGSSYQAP